MPVQAFVLPGICLSRHLSANRVNIFGKDIPKKNSFFLYTFPKLSEALVITCVQYIPSAGSVLLAVIKVQFFQGIKLQRKGWACRSFPSRPGHDGLA